MKFIHLFYIFSPLHVNLNSPSSGTFSHFEYFHFLALFFVLFGFVYITSENQPSPHRHQRNITFHCCALPSPVFSHPSAFALFPFSFHPWFLSSFSSFFEFLLVFSLHPSCQADWGTLLGRCWQIAAGLFGGLYQVSTPTKESFSSPATLLAGVIPPLRLGLYTKQFLCENSGKGRCDNLGSICQYLMSYISFLVLGGLCRYQNPQQQQQNCEDVKCSISKGPGLTSAALSKKENT